VHLVTEADTPSAVVLHVFYFPGWSATANGQPIPVEPVGPLGLVRVLVPPGRQDVVASFGDTPVRTAATVASAIAGLLLVSVLARALGVRRVLALGALAGLGLVVPWLIFLHVTPSPDPTLRPTEQQVTPAARVIGIGQARSWYVAGATVKLTVLWQATKYTDLDQESGLQLVNLGSGRVVAEHWSRPDLDRTPTGKWVLGELVPDRLALVVPRSAPPGRYGLRVGLRMGAWSTTTPVAEVEVR
jgi:hypothetical protein